MGFNRIFEYYGRYLNIAGYLNILGDIWILSDIWISDWDISEDDILLYMKKAEDEQ